MLRKTVCRSYYYLIVCFFIAMNSNSFGADKYEIDVSHTYIGFSIKHMVISTVKGSYTEFSGTIIVDENDLARSSVGIVIKANSITTNNEKRDNHLKSPDFFDVEKYPEVTFRSKTVKKKDGNYIVEGELTIHGVSKNVAITFSRLGPIKNPWGKQVIAIEGELTIDRTDYGLNFNKTLETGGLLVGNEVKIELTIEAVKQ